MAGNAWKKVAQWSRRREEFTKRAAFALLWGLTVHDKVVAEDAFIDGLSLIERAADDERHFVKKAVNMALRAIGRRSQLLNTAAVQLAQLLADSEEASARWIGTDAFRELTGASVTRRDSSRRPDGIADTNPAAERHGSYNQDLPACRAGLPLKSDSSDVQMTNSADFGLMRALRSRLAAKCRPAGGTCTDTVHEIRDDTPRRSAGRAVQCSFPDR